MSDAIFSNPRLAAIYDELDPDRRDLLPYEAMVREFGAASVLDIGCGTGAFACLLAQHGIAVTGLDPAGASLEVAAAKPFADRVHWVHGDVSALPPMQCDLATMTGNVAQVFVTDADWIRALDAARTALRPDGRLVFEVRDPEQQAWQRWDRPHTWRRVALRDAGVVEIWTDLLAIELPLVTFRHSFVFESDGAVVTSVSTLCFRSAERVETDLRGVGFTVAEVRDAPDRPGLEFVFVARRDQG